MIRHLKLDQTYYQEFVSDTSTTSTSYVTVISNTFSSYSELTTFRCSIGVGSSNAGAIASFRLVIDGATKQEVQSPATNGGNSINFNWVGTLDPGLHSLSIDWKTNTGTIFLEVATFQDYLAYEIESTTSEY